MTEPQLKLWGFYSIFLSLLRSNILESPSSNPIKITIALEELGLKYEYLVLDVKSSNLQADGIERESGTYFRRAFDKTT